MPLIVEQHRETGQRMEFEFPADWQVVKYDQQADPTTAASAGFYWRIIQSAGVKHIQAMDIVCYLPYSPQRLQFIEIKDDRTRTLNAADRHNELYEAVLGKTLGTLAGLALAERLRDESLQSVAILSQQPAIEVVLFLLEPPPITAENTGSRRALRRLARAERKTTLDQRLTAALREWGLSFKLYNLTNRPPTPWEVRDLA